MGEEQNMKLVLAVEKYPCLYNYELPQYSRKDATDKAWSEVAKEVQMTAATCKEKWRNLRSVFMRHIKVPPGGTGKRKKPYYLLDVMRFLIPYTKTHIPHESVYLSSEHNTTGSLTTEDQEDLDPSAEQPEGSPDVTMDQSIWEINPVTINTPVQNATKRKRSHSDIDESVVNYLKKKVSNFEGASCIQGGSLSRSDATKMFLISLLPELDEMTDRELKVFKRRVMHLIDEITGSEHSQIVVKAEQ